MSIWLILTPAIAWATAGWVGWYLLRTPADRIWRNLQLTTARIPYNPKQHRGVAIAIRWLGGFFLAMPVFLTLMSLLVIAGVVSPAKN
jgi:hypothetical protein